MKRIMFGGSFNPVHLGHAAMVKAALLDPTVDIVTVVPARCSPFKSEEGLCDGEKRLEMCRLAFEGFEKTEVSDIEFSLPYPSFTVNTLSRLSSLYPGDGLGLLIGGDSVMGLCKWRESEKIIETAEIFAAVRNGADRAAVEKELCRIGARYSIVNMKEIDISSTDIRERLKRGLSCSGLLDKRVEKYIIDNRLYR